MITAYDARELAYRSSELKYPQERARLDMEINDAIRKKAAQCSTSLTVDLAFDDAEYIAYYYSERGFKVHWNRKEGDSERAIIFIDWGF